VAQGRAVFDCRAKPGAVLYVAAEDSSGMRQRVHALKLAQGDAPDFALVDCGNLNDTAAAADLLDAVDFMEPAMVVIDTVSAAWAGVDENDSAGMGAVVALARRIAATGPAVMLVHHIAKNGDGTPRGHSILNGTLDFCISLTAADENMIVRGRLTKNRNGPCDLDLAFRQTAATLGVDEDGDAITAPIACALPRQVEGAARPKLSPRETRALEILIDCDCGGGVTEAAWHAAAEDLRLVASDLPAERRKVAARVLRVLLDKGAATVRAGLLYPAHRDRQGQARDSGGQGGTEFNAVL
jgi:hypothetical protein